MENRDIDTIDLEEFRALSINNEKLELLIKVIEDTSYLSYDNETLSIDGDDVIKAVKILFPCKYQKILNDKQYKKSSDEKEK